MKRGRVYPEEQCLRKEFGVAVRNHAELSLPGRPGGFLEKRISLVRVAHSLGEAGMRRVASSCVVHVCRSCCTAGEVRAWKSRGSGRE